MAPLANACGEAAGKRVGISTGLGAFDRVEAEFGQRRLGLTNRRVALTEKFRVEQSLAGSTRKFAPASVRTFLSRYALCKARHLRKPM
ncbi:hypothetical protein BCAR13_730046 [Paraburkholderia caribensis]|nr:hypothetical protein BCAR13_730046 [Paraburkholderia caribensis]